MDKGTDRNEQRVVLRGGRVLSMDPAVGDFDVADVLIEGERIVEVGPGADAEGAEVVDAAGRIIIPGFVDTHRHMWQAAFRGLGADDSIGDYFTRFLNGIGPAATPAEVHLGTLLSAVSALDAGVTTVLDTANVQNSPAHTDAGVAALKESGLRAVFSYMESVRRTAPDALHPVPGGLSTDVRRVRSELLHDDGALVRMALSPGLWGDDETVRRDYALAAELNVPATPHTGATSQLPRPVSRLRELGVLRPGGVFIHGTGLDADEMRVIADSGGAVSIAPAIEMIMGHGEPPFAAAAAAGLRPSLSTDVESTVGSDMFGPLRAAFQFARYQAFCAAEHMAGARDVGAMTVRDVLESATIAGARALGLADRTGSITPGKQADLVVLRTDRPGTAPVYDPYATVVLSMDVGDVETVLVAGRTVKRDGRLLRTDVPNLIEHAGRIRDRVRGRELGEGARCDPRSVRTVPG
jgi:cytosine/adenosine deaminase-related metal-dependent hydrolase